VLCPLFDIVQRCDWFFFLLEIATVVWSLAGRSDHFKLDSTLATCKRHVALVTLKLGAIAKTQLQKFPTLTCSFFQPHATDVVVDKEFVLLDWTELPNACFCVWLVCLIRCQNKQGVLCLQIDNWTRSQFQLCMCLSALFLSLHKLSILLHSDQQAANHWAEVASFAEAVAAGSTMSPIRVTVFHPRLIDSLTLVRPTSTVTDFRCSTLWRHRLAVAMTPAASQYSAWY